MGGKKRGQQLGSKQSQADREAGSTPATRHLTNLCSGQKTQPFISSKAYPFKDVLYHLLHSTPPRLLRPPRPLWVPQWGLQGLDLATGMDSAENKSGGSLGTSHHNDSHQAGLIWLQPRFMHSSNSSDIAVGQSLFSPQIHPLPFSNSRFYYIVVHLSGISNSMLHLLAAWQVSKKHIFPLPEQLCLILYEEGVLLK